MAGLIWTRSLDDWQEDQHRLADLLPLTRHLPAIQTEYLALDEQSFEYYGRKLDSADCSSDGLPKADRFDLVVVTSRRAVTGLGRSKWGERLLRTRRFLCHGESTADALQAAGARYVGIVTSARTSAELAGMLASAIGAAAFYPDTSYPDAFYRDVANKRKHDSNACGVSTLAPTAAAARITNTDQLAGMLAQLPAPRRTCSVASQSAATIQILYPGAEVLASDEILQLATKTAQLDRDIYQVHSDHQAKLLRTISVTKLKLYRTISKLTDTRGNPVAQEHFFSICEDHSVVALTSPSAVAAFQPFLDNNPRAARSLTAVSIGPSTTKAAERVFEHVTEASCSTLASLIQTIRNFL